MSQEKEAEILPHNYDGIKELNNPLPGWWLFTFYITIVFSIFYYGYYEIFDGPSSDVSLNRSLEEIQGKRTELDKKIEERVVLSFAELIADKPKQEAAKKHFTSMCAACHGQMGEGLIGPNLTDDYWISSKGDVEGVLAAIREGFPAKGMPPWKDLIPLEDQPYLAAYVVRLMDTDPPNGKAPQGEKIER